MSRLAYCTTTYNAIIHIQKLQATNTLLAIYIGSFTSKVHFKLFSNTFLDLQYLEFKFPNKNTELTIQGILQILFTDRYPLV